MTRREILERCVFAFRDSPMSSYERKLIEDEIDKAEAELKALVDEGALASIFVKTQCPHCGNSKVCVGDTEAKAIKQHLDKL